MLVDGRWGPKMLFEPIAKCSPRFSNIFFRAVYVLPFKSVDYPTLGSLLSLSLGGIRSVFIVVVPLKCTCIPILLHVPLNLPPVPVCM